MTDRSAVALKICLTLLLCLAVAAAWTSDWGRAALDRYADVNGGLIALVAAVFLTGVFLYARALHRCLELIRPQARAMKPKAVWLMFILPYNFVEDFDIIRKLEASLKREAELNPALPLRKSYGLATGWGWCTAQILSLFPGVTGEAGAVAGLLLWGLHWRYVTRCMRALQSSTDRKSDDGGGENTC